MAKLPLPKRLLLLLLDGPFISSIGTILLLWGPGGFAAAIPSATCAVVCLGLNWLRLNTARQTWLLNEKTTMLIQATFQAAALCATAVSAENWESLKNRKVAAAFLNMSGNICSGIQGMVARRVSISKKEVEALKVQPDFILNWQQPGATHNPATEEQPKKNPTNGIVYDRVAYAAWGGAACLTGNTTAAAVFFFTSMGISLVQPLCHAWGENFVATAPQRREQMRREYAAAGRGLNLRLRAQRVYFEGKFAVAWVMKEEHLAVAAMAVGYAVAMGQHFLSGAILDGATNAAYTLSSFVIYMRNRFGIANDPPANDNKQAVIASHRPIEAPATAGATRVSSLRT